MLAKILGLALLFTILIIIRPNTVLSADTSELQQKIDEYTKKISDLSTQKDSLANEVKRFDSQIKLAELKIAQSELSINTLQQEISLLSTQIGRLDTDLNKISSIYLEQVNSIYKLSKTQNFLAFLLDKSFSKLVFRYKYLSSLQTQNRNLLVSLETARTNYDLQKVKKSQKQQELEQIQAKLDEQKNNLSVQKLSKAKLLELTKNDEQKYMALRKEAEDELSSLLKAKFVGKHAVKKGEAIGLMGNTGYSFGAHLHFSLYNLSEDNLASFNYYNDTDPYSYLKANRWPMENYTLTQGRGATQFAYMYKDHFHHGIDMVSSNKSVYAVNDGVAYFYRGTTSFGNHIRLFHQDGKMTLYLHLQ